jgi:hypothetical protein
MEKRWIIALLQQIQSSQLQQLNATTGKSDISVTGVLKILWIYFRNQELKGNFRMNSNSRWWFYDNWRGQNPQLLLLKPEAMNPCFLKLYANSKCHYRFVRQFNLKDVSGKLIVKDEK